MEKFVLRLLVIFLNAWKIEVQADYEATAKAKMKHLYIEE